MSSTSCFSVAGR